MTSASSALNTTVWGQVAPVFHDEPTQQLVQNNHKNKLYAVQQIRGKKKKGKKGKKGKHDDDDNDNQDAKETIPNAKIVEADSEHVYFDDDEPLDEDEDEDDGLPDPKLVQERMDQILASFTDSIQKIRGAEPTPELFDDVSVPVYGETVPLKTIAQVVITSSTVAHATCFDPNVASPVCEAIRIQLEMNPSVEEGGVVRIPLPRISMETREKTCKQVAKKTEHIRQKLRAIRRKHLDVVKQGVAGKLEHVSKDEAFRLQTKIQDLADQVLHKLNHVSQAKQDSIMAVQS